VLISRTQRAVGTTEVEIDPARETQCGLRYRSVVSCTNLLTVDQGLVAQTMGHLSAHTMHNIDVALKQALGLP
jgi:mRNA-degrading endonuclease toxin of MazEF toxin-antitoxin module